MELEYDTMPIVGVQGSDLDNYAKKLTDLVATVLNPMLKIVDMTIDTIFTVVCPVIQAANFLVQLVGIKVIDVIVQDFCKKKEAGGVRSFGMFTMMVATLLLLLALLGCAMLLYKGGKAATRALTCRASRAEKMKKEAKEAE